MTRARSNTGPKQPPASGKTAPAAGRPADQPGKRQAQKPDKKRGKKLASTPPPPAPPAGEPLRQGLGRAWWAVLGGALTFMAFPFRAVPESGIWPLAWISLVPLLWAIRGASPRRAFLLGWLAGTITNFGGFWWITEVLHDFGHLPAAVSWGISGLNAAYQGAQIGLFAAALAWLGRSGPFTVAAVFTGIEYLFPMIFPWYLGNCQYPFLPAIQIADVLGVSGVTFTVALTNGALASAIDHLARRRPAPRATLALAAVLVAASLAYGVVRIGQVDADVARADTLDVGMVEANIGIWEKEAKGMDGPQQVRTLHRNLLIHQRMSAELEARGVDLIVWPESSYFPVGEVYGKRLDDFAVGVGAAPRLVTWRDTRGSEGGGGLQWRVGPGVDGPLEAVAASREDAVAAVGPRGRVVAFDGRVVRPVRVAWGASEPLDLHGVAVREKRGRGRARDGAPVAIWAVGQGGVLLRGDQDGLRPLHSGTTRTLRDVALATAGRGIAVGDGGTVLALSSKDGGRVIEAGIDEDLLAVLADPDGVGFWAVGAGGRVLRGDHAAWRTEKAPTQATLRDLVGRSGAAIFAVGDGGAVLRREPGGAWVVEPFPERVDLVTVTEDPRGALLAGDAAGGLWRRDMAGVWRRLEAPGIGPVRDLAPMPWVRMAPIPRDARHLYQSPAPLPEIDAFEADAEIEWRRPLAQRTAVQRGYTTPVLFGAITWEERPDPTDDYPRTLYNSAVLLDEGGRIVGIYDKVYLLVFGEYIPLGDLFPFVYEWIPEAGRFVSGTDVQVFDDGEHRFGVMICYEDILPAFTGELLAQDPELIVNITNDAWFGRTGEPYLHLALSIMRSVETRRSLLRSTNTGVSAVIDPVGRLVQQSDLERPEVLVATVPRMHGSTIYAGVGDLFAYAVLLVVGALALVRRFTLPTPRR